MLYALATRRLPFDAWDAAGHEEGVRHEAYQAEGRRVRGPRQDERSERRAPLTDQTTRTTRRIGQIQPVQPSSRSPGLMISRAKPTAPSAMAGASAHGWG